jgi:hypothetical protein
MSPRSNLKTAGTWYKKSGRTQENACQFKKYQTPACKNCLVKHLCTSRTTGRELSEANHENKKVTIKLIEANTPMPWKKTTNVSRKSTIVPQSAGD